jgi:hypothetical protein
MKKIVLFAVAVLFAGCATVPYQPYARDVKRKPGEGGVIALKTEHRPEDRQFADSKMASNCGSDAIVKVSEEGEVEVGEKTNTVGGASKTNNEGSGGFKLGGITFGSAKPSEDTTTHASSETVKLKEWHIAYNCVAHKEAAPAKKGISRK